MEKIMSKEKSDKKLKILVMTSVYPSPNEDKNYSITPVVHYFTKQWISMGHEVIVIFNVNRYPLLFSLLPNRVTEYLMSKFSFVPLINKNDNNQPYYLDGVKVFKLPLLKVIPRGIFFKPQIVKQSKKIITSLKNDQFEPDIIISHWDNPQLQIASILKSHYKVPITLTFHGLSNLTNKLSAKSFRNTLKDVDAVGFRSLKMQKEYHELIGKHKNEFLCYSGLPDNYVEAHEIKKKNFNRIVKKYLYVGSLIKRKNPDTIIRALAMYKGDRFELNIVGDGPMRNELELLTEKLGVKNNVIFHGRKSRIEVINLMKENEVFTMVSKNEVFGLVYLEAMLQGCIVICSKDEGFDGIIQDKVNGFICEQGNIEKLASIYEFIDTMDSYNKEKLSYEAINTAKTYTDSKVAYEYLLNISPLLSEKYKK
jgi:L-malate glycosyltransferase